jgi:hypothetical protein
MSEHGWKKVYVPNVFMIKVIVNEFLVSKRRYIKIEKQIQKEERS